jgi:sugar lactone lactonase YvrE
MHVALLILLTIAVSFSAFLLMARPHVVSAASDEPTVSIVAGDGNPGYADGPVSSAQFSYPQGVTIDAMGNVYVADSGNNRIRKVTPDGTVSTVAGSGNLGYLDGPAVTAQFYGIRSVAVGPSGDLFVVDSYNNRIRKVTQDGMVSTVAGDGNFGYIDGPAPSAQFGEPYDIAFGPSGDLYVAESGHGIRKIAPDGTVSTIALIAGPNRLESLGEAEGTPVELSSPMSIAADAAGNIFVAHYQQMRIEKISPDGVVNTLNTYDNMSEPANEGPISSVGFSMISSLATDSTGNLYVTSIDDYSIRKITFPQPEVVTPPVDGSTDPKGPSKTPTAPNTGAGQDTLSVAVCILILVLGTTLLAAFIFRPIAKKRR